MRTVQIAHSEGRARVARLQNELRLLRGKLGDVNKRQNLGDLLVRYVASVQRLPNGGTSWPRHGGGTARRNHFRRSADCLRAQLGAAKQTTRQPHCGLTIVDHFSDVAALN
jgi:hypothetical protein